MNYLIIVFEFDLRSVFQGFKSETMFVICYPYLRFDVISIVMNDAHKRIIRLLIPIITPVETLPVIPPPPL